jgi:hypothetical protein
MQGSPCQKLKSRTARSGTWEQDVRVVLSDLNITGGTHRGGFDVIVRRNGRLAASGDGSGARHGGDMHLIAYAGEGGEADIAVNNDVWRQGRDGTDPEALPGGGREGNGFGVEARGHGNGGVGSGRRKWNGESSAVTRGINTALLREMMCSALFSWRARRKRGGAWVLLLSQEQQHPGERGGGAARRYFPPNLGWSGGVGVGGGGGVGEGAGVGLGEGAGGIDSGGSAGRLAVNSRSGLPAKVGREP